MAPSVARLGLRETPDGRPDAATAKRPQRADASARRLLCRACLAPITSDAERTSVAGRHVHERTNRAGIAFVFGCFRAAPGARVVGRPTLEHTWFAGHAWSFSLCGGCGEHLGWCFHGEAERFHGLILDRLVEEASSPRQ